MTALDVIVVGGGLGGLTTARSLEDGGASVLVLEARDRVGGRTVNKRVGKADFDLGGQWLGPTQDRVYALARRLGIATFPTHGAGRKVMEVRGRVGTYKGTIPTLALHKLLLLQRAISSIERLAKTVPADTPWTAKRADIWDAMTLEDWKRRHVPSRDVRDTVDVAIRAVFGAEAAELSMLHFLMYLRSGGGMMKLVEVEGGAQQDRFVGGSWLMSAGLARELGERVRLSTPVAEIAQDGDGVTVRTAGGESLRAKRVVVAVPPALAGRIRYAPALPGARAGLTQRWPMGAITKAIIAYDRPFWRERGFSGEAVSTTGPVTLTFDNCTSDGAQPALLAFICGTAARRLSGQPDERRRLVLEALVRWFGPDARDPVDYVDLDWGAEEWTGGCPTGFASPGTLTALGLALRDPVGRIHFAGTETATVWTGYLEGAIESGERTAREVLAAL